MTSKAGHTATKGPWRASQTYPLGDWVVHAAGIPQQLAYLAASPHVDWPLEANARLIAEAGTILHETGLTPRQLAERCERLETALVGVTDLYCELANSGDAGFWDPEKVDEVIAARAALSKATAGGAA